TVFNGFVYFVGTIGQSSCGTGCIELIDKIFKINANQTVSRVSNTRNSATLPDYPRNLVVVGDYLYYLAMYQTAGYDRLFRMNTSDASSRTINIRATPVGFNSNPDVIDFITKFNNDVYFQAATAASN